MTETLLPQARAVLAQVAADDVPLYGSAEHQALPLADPRWLASVVRAAECWRLDGTPEAVARRLLDEDRALAHRVRHASYDVCDGWRLRQLDPPGPWPYDATVPEDFYPPGLAA